MNSSDKAANTTSTIDGLEQVRMNPEQRRLARASVRQAELLVEWLVRGYELLRQVFGFTLRYRNPRTPQQGIPFSTRTAIAMTTHREERGSCLIEADALDLQNGRHWKPWLRLTRNAGGVSASHTFPGLMPVFGTEQAALRYATELGKMLIDEGSVLAPLSDLPRTRISPRPNVAAVFKLWLQTAGYALINRVTARSRYRPFRTICRQ